MTTPSGQRRRNAMAAAIAARPTYSSHTTASVRSAPALRSISRLTVETTKSTRAMVTSCRRAFGAGSRTQAESRAKKSAARARHVVTAPA